MRKIILALWAVLMLNEAQGAMVAVTTDGIDGGPLQRGLPFCATQREESILLMSSPEEFANHIARLATEFYGIINRNFRFRASKEDPKVVHSELWESGEESVQRGEFIVKIGTLKHIQGNSSPAAALIDLAEKGGVIDCTVARTLVEALITLKFAGQERFDHGFREGLCLPSALPTLGKTGVGIPQTPGESGYFSNVSNYFMLYPAGSANGQNVFCVGRNAAGLSVYLGFGPFFATPKTAAEIIEYLYQATISQYVPTGNEALDITCSLLIHLFRQSREYWDMVREEAQANIPRTIITIFAQARIPAALAARAA